MIESQVRAEYDFDAQPGSGELSIKANEILTVVRDGIDGGWMEGRNAKGQLGLFPESYVSRISPSPAPASAPPSTAPPPLPATVSNLPSYSVPPGEGWDDYPMPSFPPPQKVSPHQQQSVPPPSHASTRYDDDFDDDWTDEDEEQEARASISIHEDVTQHPSTHPKHQQSRSRSQSRATATSGGSRTDISTDDEGGLQSHSSTAQTLSTPLRKGTLKEHSNLGVNNQRAVSRSRSVGADTMTSTGHRAGSGGAGGAGAASRMKNINRFSNFVKTGMESYILAASRMTSPAHERHEIIDTPQGIEWAPIQQHYTCTVDNPKKESKLKGLKSFIAYSVTSSLNGIQVSRRYKHFDWLHEQLSQKYILIPIPPLPEKQVSGRYEEELIEHRKNILMLWVAKICRHPVLSKSDVWMHFLTCTDEKRWKVGKRAAEKDEYVGGNFFHCLTVPDQPLDVSMVERKVDNFQRCVRCLDDSVKVMYDRIHETQKRMTGPYKANWQKLAAAFSGLGQSFEMDATPHNQQVTAALKETAHVYHKIGDLHDEQSKNDCEPFLDSLYAYKGLLSAMPDIVNVHKNALAKLRENERLSIEGKLSQSEADKIKQRVDVTSYAMIAEINHQNKERVDDFKKMMHAYLTEQAAFYRNISDQLSHLAKEFA
uniref:Sorting nexin n=1 Tax=Steinernema glaseri TaxID=37863 RepID=A0A1I8A6A5_9BILA